MVVVVKKGLGKKKLDEALQKIKYIKKFNSKRHLGKVKWDMDALEFQKKIRNEWD